MDAAIKLSIYHKLIARIPFVRESSNYRFNLTFDQRLNFYTSNALICLINLVEVSSNEGNNAFKFILEKFEELNNSHANNRAALYVQVHMQRIRNIFKSEKKISFVNYIKNMVYIGR